MLNVKGLSKEFGGVVAVNDLSFRVEEKTIKSIIGPNGAGKTTLFNLLTGLVPSTRGRISFLGRDISRLRPYVIARMGVSRSFQNVEIFDNMSILFARALAPTPKLLLLDEPASGLNMRETEQIARLIRKIRDTGVTVMLVEHDMSVVMEISDDVLVMDYGVKIAEGKPREVQKNPEVILRYLGRSNEYAKDTKP
ncbi:MAG: ATP-binding cassette domain-containing protein [Candidatus Lindowbacteria bacterium]|nr:ATP-binding cassette domain-containing protein [Candidatus Lindowbacteria bacterium]